MVETLPQLPALSFAVHINRVPGSWCEAAFTGLLLVMLLWKHSVNLTKNAQTLLCFENLRPPYFIPNHKMPQIKLDRHPKMKTETVSLSLKPKLLISR